MRHTERLQFRRAMPALFAELTRIEQLLEAGDAAAAVAAHESSFPGALARWEALDRMVDEQEGFPAEVTVPSIQGA